MWNQERLRAQLESMGPELSSVLQGYADVDEVEISPLDAMLDSEEEQRFVVFAFFGFLGLVRCGCDTGYEHAEPLASRID